MAITLPTTTEEEAAIEAFRQAHNADPANSGNQMATIEAYTYYRMSQVLANEISASERTRFNALWLDPAKRAAAIAAGEAV
jgi:hypothetical protein